MYKNAVYLFGTVLLSQLISCATLPEEQPKRVTEISPEEENKERCPDPQQIHEESPARPFSRVEFQMFHSRCREIYGNPFYCATALLRRESGHIHVTCGRR